MMQNRNQQIEEIFKHLQSGQDELDMLYTRLVCLNQLTPLILASARSMKRLNEKVLLQLSRQLYPHICSWCGIGYEGQPYMVDGYVWPLCSDCTRTLNLAERVRAHCARAKKLGLPATLTLDGWLVTLEHFGWSCAYCMEAKAHVLEHFIPLSYGAGEGAGTTVGNCVPSCHHCNTLKSNWHPDEVKAISREVLAYVGEQLRLLSGGAL